MGRTNDGQSDVFDLRWNKPSHCSFNLCRCWVRRDLLAITGPFAYSAFFCGRITRESFLVSPYCLNLDEGLTTIFFLMLRTLELSLLYTAFGAECSLVKVARRCFIDVLSTQDLIPCIMGLEPSSPSLSLSFRSSSLRARDEIAQCRELRIRRGVHMAEALESSDSLSCCQNCSMDCWPMCMPNKESSTSERVEFDSEANMVSTPYVFNSESGHQHPFQCSSNSKKHTRIDSGFRLVLYTFKVLPNDKFWIYSLKC